MVPRFLSAILVAFLIAMISLHPTDALFKNKKKEEESAQKARETINAGMNEMSRMAKDPSMFMETMQAMKDPETMKEVEKLMKDPAFKKEMERLKEDPVFVNAMQSAKEMYSDPATAAKVVAQMKQQKIAAEVALEDGKANADLGMQGLAEAAKNPKMLMEAMEMLKDPAVAAEVQSMMKDPAFQAEMKKYTDSGAYKEAMERAAQDIDALSRDPQLMQKLKAGMAG